VAHQADQRSNNSEKMSCSLIGLFMCNSLGYYLCNCGIFYNNNNNNNKIHFYFVIKL